ncbi:MAG: DNA/RNA non-specific endonuclease [Propionibacteriaceae bacterium]
MSELAAVVPFGYDASFLGLDVALPRPADPTRITRDLTYTHFTVLLDPVRRLAVNTGVNIDGADLVILDRPDDWYLDPRVPAEEQVGEEVYARNDLDRGHLVRRRDPVWGEPEVAAQANVDTFAFPNAAPQDAEFNQGKELWLGLEDYLLTYADTYEARLSIFTAPVLADADPVYRGVQIPLQFFKVAAWSLAPDIADAPGVLAATGYVLDQTPELDDEELARATARELEAGNPPPLGPYRTYQVPVADIVTLTGLDLAQLVAADQLPAPVPGESGWVRLTSVTDIRAGRLSVSPKRHRPKRG